jgi:hypothetical protein
MANEFVIKNGYFSQGNSNVTGSLQVTGSVGVTGSVSITQNVTASKALFSSSNGDQLTVMGSGSTVAQVYGSQGNLLTVNDTFSGSVFTVTDISGYSILDITSDYYTSSINIIGFLNHTGSAGVTGSLIVSGSTISTLGFTGSLFGTASYVTGSIFTSTNRALSASYALTSSVIEITNDILPAIPASRYLTFVYNTGNSAQSLKVTSSLAYNQQTNTIFATASQALTASYFSGFNSTSSILGNGLSSSFNINHGFNTLNLHITVYSASGTYETVYPDIRRVNANTASIVFANPPLTNEYIVYISQ